MGFAASQLTALSHNDWYHYRGLVSSTLNDIDKKIKTTGKSLSEVGDKIQKIMAAIETGADFGSLKRRLAELEEQKKELNDDLLTLQMKKEKTEQAILSADVVTMEYASVPKIIDELILSRNMERLKNILQQYIEVIEWKEDEKDSKFGRMKIMLFEHAQPVEEPEIKKLQRVVR